MKKRTLGLILALTVAFSLLAVTAYASAPTFEGYEAFKDMAKSRDDGKVSHENASVTGQVFVKDNGETLVDISTVLKNEDEAHGSGWLRFKANGVTKELSVYKTDKDIYIFDELEELYYVADKEAMEANRSYEYEGYDEYGQGRDKYEEMTSTQEDLLDFIMGDLKDDFDITYHDDGSETITFELTKEEIPMLLNLIVSAIDGHDKNVKDYDEFSPDPTLLTKYPILSDFMSMENNTPEIVDNIEVDYIKVEVTRKDDTITGMKFGLKISGDDKEGASHLIEVNAAFEVSQLASTVADKPDLMGKELIEMNPADFESLQDEEMDHQGKFKVRR